MSEVASAVGPARAEVRVAALMDTAHVSGPGRQLVALARALAPLGVEIRFLLFHRRGRPRPAYADFVAAAGLPHVIVPESGRFDPGLATRVAAVLEAWEPDIVQTHSYRPTVLAWLLRRRARWRWVAYFHGTTNEDAKVRVYHWLDRKLLPRADRLIVVSPAQRARFGVPDDRMHWIPNAVLPSEAVARQPLDPAVGAAIAALPAPRVGVVGRLSHEKGVDLFLEAVGRLRARGWTGSGVIAGDGPERAALQAQTRALGLEDRVRFIGNVSAVESLYAALDLVVLPSRSEGLPNVLLEAVRAGCLVVATRVGAVAEVLEGSPAGIIVPPGDVGALADAIERILREPPPDAAAGRRQIVERFSLEHRVEAHLSLYADVLGRPVAPPAVQV